MTGPRKTSLRKARCSAAAAGGGAVEAGRRRGAEIGPRSCRDRVELGSRSGRVGEDVGHLPEEDAALGAHGDDALAVGRHLGHDDGARVARALEVLRALVVVPQLDFLVAAAAGEGEGEGGG